MKLFRQTDKEIWSLALPIILSNISVVLLGLVDTAVIGHLDSNMYLGGVAIGTMATSFLFMSLIFFRMSTTGLTVKAFAVLDNNALSRALVQPMLLAIATGIIIIIMREPLIKCILSIIGEHNDVLEQACIFMRIRLLGTPAALANLVILGWLLGVQYVRAPVILLVFSNIINIILNLWFVRGLYWQVVGTASATTIADYITFFLGIGFLFHAIKVRGLYWRFFHNAWYGNWYRLLSFNRDIMLRSVLLQLCPLSLTILGARMGHTVVAVNAVLMNLLSCTSYVLDGLAYSVEVFSGQACSVRDILRIQNIWYAACRQAGIIAIFFSLFYAICGRYIITILTSLSDIQELANYYLPWQIILPFLGVWCYLLDGMFIGATRGGDMRNSMAISVTGYGLTLLTLPWLGNNGLWLALAVFLSLRGLSLWIFWQYHWFHGTWFKKSDNHIY
ncbi:MATE family efflux transporter DinF [Candidatus Profftia sp. (ex Adelges kitamiensis)]|uniref:MATE family efflux transporter DinF n=1 Tax=Candidatus Profftia sp. (ex Adelges kitamiensis) TaxID=2864218 RepID=UPI001CE2BD5B|nr:MATE family efflux transporter DinF [Candidatus Profftia sp. (ex Adelges kitamiensis)]